MPQSHLCRFGPSPTSVDTAFIESPRKSDTNKVEQTTLLNQFLNILQKSHVFMFFWQVKKTSPGEEAEDADENASTEDT